MVQKSGVRQLRLVIFRIIHRVLAPSQLVQDFFHQQYLQVNPFKVTNETKEHYIISNTNDARSISSHPSPSLQNNHGEYLSRAYLWNCWERESIHYFPDQKLMITSLPSLNRWTVSDCWLRICQHLLSTKTVGKTFSTIPDSWTWIKSIWFWFTKILKIVRNSPEMGMGIPSLYDEITRCWVAIGR